jgi:hypothetical protein
MCSQVFSLAEYQALKPICFGIISSICFLLPNLLPGAPLIRYLLQHGGQSKTPPGCWGQRPLSA